MNQIESLQQLYKRDLKKLKEETLIFPEEQLWEKFGQIKNPAGNLIMHLTGNLQHYIGAVLFESGYKRDRDFEFRGQKPKSELLKEIDDTIALFERNFGKLKVEQLNDQYDQNPFGQEMTVSHFLIHLYGHLNWHLGQISYLRQLL
jgi:uncharacterized damage-inducible protein DinB